MLDLYGDGCRLIAGAVTDLACGREPPGAMQPASGGHYYSTPEPESLRAFGERGLILADGSEFSAVQQ